MKDNIEKMVEEYFIKNGISPNDCVQVGERVVHYKKLTADFAEFHHREKMKELIPGDQELDNAAADYATELHKHEDGDYTETAEAFDAGAIWMRNKLVPVTKTEEG